MEISSKAKPRTKQGFFAKRLFDGDRIITSVRFDVENSKITQLMADQKCEHADVILDGLVVPGFVDLQVNGGGDVLFNSTPTVDGLKTIMAAHARFGTTAMMPTVITDTVDVMRSAADAVAKALSEQVPGIIGIHFEGPHLAIAKKGAHSGQCIREISDAEWQVLMRQDIGHIIVTMAPETVAEADIKRMCDMGIHVCIGHTNASYKQTQQAVNAGADGFTHLFNAMSALTSREPGVVGCALVNDHTSCGIIADGHHVDFVSLKIAQKAKPKGRVFLVTDAMPPVGTQSTTFNFFDRQVTLNNGKLTSTTGELAGSVLDMATAVRNMHQHINVSLEESLNMASLYPSTYLGVQAKHGQLRVGARADMLVLNESLVVEQTWIAGKKLTH